MIFIPAREPLSQAATFLSEAFATITPPEEAATQPEFAYADGPDQSQAVEPIFTVPSVFKASPSNMQTNASGGGSSAKRPPRIDRTILILGDGSDLDAFDKFRRELTRHSTNRFHTVIATYDQLEADHLPVIETDSIVIYPFFPFAYWDKNIEHDAYEGVYGNVDFYNKFRALWDGINSRLNAFYSGKRLHFINHPLRISVDRDKELTKATLSKAGIDVPAPIFTRSYTDILDLVNEAGKKLYLKVRYGSMGKGITYMEQGRWMTNFRFEHGQIVSMHADHGWTFIDITNNTDFLKELLTKDLVIEEAIECPVFDGQKFDLRFYVCFDDVLYIFPRTNDSGAVTTNISQGGQGRSSPFLKRLSPQIIRTAARVAVKATEVMGLEFAGVDIMISNDMKHAYVIELNAFPGFPRARRFNLSRRIIRSIENHVF